MYISIYIYVLQMKFEKFTRCDAQNYQKYRAEVVYYQIPSNSRAKRVPSNFLSRAPSNLIEISRERGRIGLSNGRSFYRPRSLSLPITKKIPLDNPRSKPENYPLFSPFLPSPLRVSGFEDRPKCISSFGSSYTRYRRKLQIRSLSIGPVAPYTPRSVVLSKHRASHTNLACPSFLDFFLFRRISFDVQKNHRVAPLAFLKEMNFLFCRPVAN